MTTQFEHNLEDVKSKLLLMGQLANESLKGAIKALVEGDSQLAKSVRAICYLILNTRSFWRSKFLPG